MDWNPAGGSFERLRQKETWTDTDGWTALREVETSWESVTSGPTVATTLVRDPVTAWETQTQRVSDAWGREAKMSVYQQWIDFQGARKLKLTAETHRHWQDVGPGYLSLLLREETTDSSGRPTTWSPPLSMSTTSTP